MQDSRELLTSKERTEFVDCERHLHDSLNAYMIAGVYLKKIRDGRLYREQFKTFESYCLHVWGLGKRQVNLIIQACDLSTAIADDIQERPEWWGDEVPLPSNEGQCREMGNLKWDQFDPILVAKYANDLHIHPPKWDQIDPISMAEHANDLHISQLKRDQIDPISMAEHANDLHISQLKWDQIDPTFFVWRIVVEKNRGGERITAGMVKQVVALLSGTEEEDGKLDLLNAESVQQYAKPESGKFTLSPNLDFEIISRLQSPSASLLLMALRKICGVKFYTPTFAVEDAELQKMCGFKTAATLKEARECLHQHWLARFEDGKYTLFDPASVMNMHIEQGIWQGEKIEQVASAPVEAKAAPADAGDAGVESAQTVGDIDDAQLFAAAKFMDSKYVEEDSNPEMESLIFALAFIYISTGKDANSFRENLSGGRWSEAKIKDWCLPLPNNKDGQFFQAFKAWLKREANARRRLQRETQPPAKPPQAGTRAGPPADFKRLGKRSRQPEEATA